MGLKVCEFSLDEKQESLYSQFKERVRQDCIMEDLQNVSSFKDRWQSVFLNESRLVRFFFARDCKVEKALEMWRNWARWYAKEQPDSITQEMVAEQIEHQKAFWYKEDKKKNPCLVLRIRNHIPLHDKIQNEVKFFCFIMEEGVKRAEASGTNTLAIVIDGKGFKRSQLSMALLDFLKKAANILQDFYPNRLASLYMVDPDFVVKLGYSFIKPFLNSVLTSKIHQIPSKTLPTYFDLDAILPEYGGQGQQPEFNLQCHNQIQTNDPQEEFSDINNEEANSKQYEQTDEFHTINNDMNTFFNEPDLQNALNDQNILSYSGNPEQQNNPINTTTCCNNCNIV